jgi:hypothetical protein
MGKKQNFRPFQTINGGHFVSLFDDMLNSPAWEELSASDIKLYIRMLSKFKVRYSKNMVNGTNENDISIPKAEYLTFLHQKTFEKSIDHLIDLGFVKVVQYRYGTRECTIYGFNDMWKCYKTSRFNIKPEWRRGKHWNKETT